MVLVYLLSDILLVHCRQGVNTHSSRQIGVQQQIYQIPEQQPYQSNILLDVALEYIGSPNLYTNVTGAGSLTGQMAFSPVLDAVGDMAEVAAAQAAGVEVAASQALIGGAAWSLAGTVILIVAVLTMPYWLPRIYQQSGIANNTLYEARASISMQAEVGKSCDKVHFHLYPYNRKDFNGRYWQNTEGDRGRACLPKQYQTTLYIPHTTLLTMQGKRNERTKNMNIFSFGIEQNQQKKQLTIEWNHA